MSAEELWTVKTAFGAYLGPMSKDVLLELARTGALVRTDEVRQGPNGHWQSAAEIPGLFRVEPTLPDAAEFARQATDEPSMAATTRSGGPHSGARLIPPRPPLVTERSAVPCESMPPPAIPDTTEARLFGTVETSPLEQPDGLAVPIPPHHDWAITAELSPEDALIRAWKQERARSTEELGLVSLAAEITESELAAESEASTLTDRASGET